MLRETRNIGILIQVIGPVVDVRFEENMIPRINNALEILHNDKKLIIEVFQHVGNGIVRCVAMGATDGLARGIEVIDTGETINVITSYSIHYTKLYEMLMLRRILAINPLLHQFL